ncbi:MAG TPA: glycosyltransferase [Polyangiaceae bacterium]|nr:glycosyltransferase [Polyangiaceae bacterium]
MPSASPPRVALFCTNFLPDSQVFIYEQLRQYRRWQADVFAWRRFNVDRFAFPRVHQAEPSYVIRGRSRRFARVFAEQPFALVHAHFGPAGAYARAYAEQARLPLLVTFHGYDVPLLSSWRRFLPIHLPYAAGGPAMLRQMRFGICASTELFDLLLELGVDAARLRVHRLGIDLDRFAFVPERRQPEVLMVGRLVEKKGFEFGLEAFARVRSRGVAARLTIVGDGERRRALERLARELGVASDVRFTGSQTNEAVSRHMAVARVLLAPSVVARDGNRESGLIVVKEASAAGTVPISTRHGGIPDSIDDGQTGYLVAERDVALMAERLEQLLLDDPLRARLAAGGRTKMEREFDNRALVAGLERIYDDAAALGPVTDASTGAG